MANPELRKSMYDISEGSQTLINLFGLINSLAFCASSRIFIASCQIYHSKLGCFGTLIISIVLIDGEEEDHVAPGCCFIHVGVALRSICYSNLYVFENFLRTSNVSFSAVLDIDTLGLTLSNLQIVLVQVKKVSNSLQVDLDEGDL